MRQVWRKVFGGPCDHKHTVVVSSVGVRRTVCESCGHMSFEIKDELGSVWQPVRQEELPTASGL